MVAVRLHSPLRVEFLDGPLVQLFEPLEWWGPFPQRLAAGFTSDGGTIPAIFWPAVGHPLSNRLLACYLLHDADLRAGFAWDTATRQFNARLAATGVADARRRAIIAGVTVRGWFR